MTEQYDSHVTAAKIETIANQIKDALCPKTERTYQWTGSQPSNPKGQVCSVLKALVNLTSGTLEDFVQEVIKLNPQYPTKTPIESSVKFHLHQLSRQGHVAEIN